MSGEHGDGRARGELLPLMYSSDAITLFERVKAAFDPDDLLSPGVVVRPAPLDADVRVAHAPALTRRELPTLALGYRHDRGDLSMAVHGCTGVGACRADAGASGVMRPSFLATRSEKDSTRARARVLQGRRRRPPRPRRLEVAGAARRARPVPVVQGLRVGLPDRRRHGLVQGGGAAPAVPPTAASTLALRAGDAAALGAPGRAVVGVDACGERRGGLAAAAPARHVVGRCRPPQVPAGLRVADLSTVVRDPRRSRPRSST